MPRGPLPCEVQVRTDQRRASQRLDYPAAPAPSGKLAADLEPKLWGLSAVLGQTPREGADQIAVAVQSHDLEACQPRSANRRR